MNKAVSCRSLTAELRVRLQASLYRITGGQIGISIGLSSGSSSFPCYYHSSCGPDSFILHQRLMSLAIDNIFNTLQHILRKILMLYKHLYCDTLDAVHLWVLSESNFSESRLHRLLLSFTS
jgi:hypothetical protein